MTEGGGWSAAMEWAAGVGVTVYFATVGLVANAIGAMRKHVDDEVGALWVRVNKVSDGNADHRAEAAGTYATRADLGELRSWIEARMELHERRMAEMIANRRGVKL